MEVSFLCSSAEIITFHRFWLRKLLHNCITIASTINIRRGGLCLNASESQVSTVTQANRGSTFALRRSTLDFCLGRQRSWTAAQLAKRTEVSPTRASRIYAPTQPGLVPFLFSSAETIAFHRFWLLKLLHSRFAITSTIPSCNFFFSTLAANITPQMTQWCSN